MRSSNMATVGLPKREYMKPGSSALKRASADFGAGIGKARGQVERFRGFAVFRAFQPAAHEPRFEAVFAAWFQFAHRHALPIKIPGLKGKSQAGVGGRSTRPFSCLFNVAAKLTGSNHHVAAT